MVSKLTKFIEEHPRVSLTQEEKFRLRYGEDYLDETLGSKYANPLYHLRKLYCKGKHWEMDEK